jgi:type IV pilus assembly PilX-like protein
MNKTMKVHQRQERGIAMIVALLALVLLAAIGMALMFMADTENSVNNNYRDSQKAYFAARAGAEAARMQLVTGGSLNSAAFSLVMPANSYAAGTSGMVYALNPTAGEAITPKIITGSPNPYLDDQLCWEKYAALTNVTPGTAGPCGATGNPITQLLASSSTAFTTSTLPTGPGTNGTDALPFKWVRVANKQNLMGALGKKVDPTQGDGLQVCWDGGHEFVIAGGTCQSQPTVVAMPVWELTSFAVTPPLGQNPGSRRIVQMEVAFNPPLIPPAPISTMAPVNLQGSFVLNAYDNCSCTCTTTGTGNNTTTSCGVAQPSCMSTAHAVFTQNNVSVTGGAGTTLTSYGTDPTQGTMTDLGPSVQRVNPWPDSLNINNLISQYKVGATIPSWGTACPGTANFTATPPTYLNCGTQTSQNFGTYPSSLPTEPSPGSFTSVTEYIPGSVKLTSDANGSGILIVDGDLEINGGLNWYGLILVRGKVSFTGGAGQNVNLYGSILAGEDVNATDQAQTDTFGGSINFHYDLCALKNTGGSSPPKLLATHEIMY